MSRDPEGARESHLPLCAYVDRAPGAALRSTRGIDDGAALYRSVACGISLDGPARGGAVAPSASFGHAPAPKLQGVVRHELDLAVLLAHRVGLDEPVLAHDGRTHLHEPRIGDELAQVHGRSARGAGGGVSDGKTRPVGAIRQINRCTGGELDLATGRDDHAVLTILDIRRHEVDETAGPGRDPALVLDLRSGGGDGGGIEAVMAQSRDLPRLDRRRGG